MQRLSEKYSIGVEHWWIEKGIGKVVVGHEYQSAFNIILERMGRRESYI
jgi:hypothetical protein